MADSNGTPNTVPHSGGGGVLQELTPAALVAKYGAGNVKTPTKNFSIKFGNGHVNGLKGIPIVCDAALLAALAAASAPVV